MELILIEGLPGSGKTTMAEMLCKAAQANGVRSNWYLEESKDHPVHPIDLKREKYSQDFPTRCLRQWKSFVSANKFKDHTFILEGSLFQSTVRVMLEGNNQDRIDEYYSDCQSILTGVSSKVLYLRPSDAVTHIDWTMKHRGVEWTTKVAEYLAKTPYCSDRQLQGQNCMRSFWSDYARLCDVLIEKTSLPCQTIKAGLGHFDVQFSQAIR